MPLITSAAAALTDGGARLAHESHVDDFTSVFACNCCLNAEQRCKRSYTQIKDACCHWSFSNTRRQLEGQRVRNAAA